MTHAHTLATALLLLGAGAGTGHAQDNYVFLMNGIDAVAPPLETAGGQNTGIFRVFDSKILHAPTKVTFASSELGKYAAQIDAIEFGIVVDPLLPVITIPLVMLSQFPGPHSPSLGATFVQTPSSFGGGLLGVTEAGGTVLWEASNLIIPIAPTFPCAVTQVTIPLNPPIAVTEGENLLLYIADSPANTVLGPNQHFVFSDDEKNLCESFSHTLDTSGTFVQSMPNEEWFAGVTVVDAVTVIATQSCGAGAKGLNAQDAFGLDAGSGGRTFSLSGSYGGCTLGFDSLGFLTYDNASSIGGTGHIIIANIAGIGVACGVPGIALPTGGAGGPVLSTAIPEQPRIVCKLDAFANSLIGNTFWVAATLHDSCPGGVNVPWYPIPATNAGATGVTGGFTVPIPAIPSLVGIEMCVCSVATNDKTHTALGRVLDSGHAHSMSYGVVFYP